MTTAAPGQGSGGEAAKRKLLGSDFTYTAEPSAVQAPDHFQHVGDVAARLLAKIGRRAGLYPRLATGGLR